MKLSLSGFIFEDDYKSQSLSFMDFVEFAKQAGYDGIELRTTQVNLSTRVETVKECRRIVDGNGMCVTCMTPRGLPMEMEERSDMFRRYIDLAVELGCTQLKLTGGDVNWICQAVKYSVGSGIELAINSHINSPTETVDGARTFFSQTGDMPLGFLYDPMHWAITAEDYLDAIEEFYPKICNVLVQCVKSARPGDAVAIEYHGHLYAKTCIDENPIQDWPAVIGKFKNKDYDGWITVIENSWPLEQRKEIAARTANHLQRLWKEV